MGTLTKYLADKDNKDYIEVDIEEGEKITDLIKKFSIPYKLISLVTINGKNSKPDSPIREGDKIKIYPFVGGG